MLKKDLKLEDIEEIEDFKKHLEDQLESNKKQSKNFKILFRIAFSVYIVMIFYIFFLSKGASYIDKKNVDQTITQAINNGSNVDVLKSILGEFPIEKDILVKRIIKNWENKPHYEAPVSLNKVLENLRNQNYTNEKLNIDFDKKINKLIEENKKINPFDNLEAYQREYFINIKIKLEEGQYNKINNDINKIITDLSEKNKLTNVYLDKSNISFYISIVAFMMTFIPLLYGAYKFYLKIVNKK